MSDELAISPRERAISKLTPTERSALGRYEGPPLSPAVQAQLFELYLNGSDTDEISRLNRNFTLGMIVRAKVDGLWDERKQAHIGTLLDTVRERVQQVQLESVMFSADLLAAANKQFGDKLKRFIQTGDESELGKDLSVNSLKQYKDAVDLMMKLTGQDKESKVKVTGEQKMTVTLQTQNKPLTSQEAASILASLEDKK